MWPIFAVVVLVLCFFCPALIGLVGGVAFYFLLLAVVRKMMGL